MACESKNENRNAKFQTQKSNKLHNSKSAVRMHF